MTLTLITSEFMEKIWNKLKIQEDDVAKLAIGPQHYRKSIFNNSETILSEIITGDIFGADRMDYLLRDSLHTGVAYGNFDYHRLIETIRVLPKEYESSDELALGVEAGGIQCTESLLLARYFMFSQLYFHHVRRIYDIHLKEYLTEWLGGSKYPITAGEFLEITDNEIISGMRKAARDSNLLGHESAKRVLMRNHFRALYSRNPDDVLINRDAGLLIYGALCREFGEENVRHDRSQKPCGNTIFPVLEPDGRVISSLSKSDVLRHIPEVIADTVYIAPDKFGEAAGWLRDNREMIIDTDVEDEI